MSKNGWHYAPAFRTIDGETEWGVVEVYTIGDKVGWTAEFVDLRGESHDDLLTQLSRALVDLGPLRAQAPIDLDATGVPS